ncbi:conserved hypothetical protein [Neospora caninum Liverpool]|nr:conserved hypothetical protein [Neospora caninum Liverpool]CBZ54102.1 conserved hypothetical protein [Neospora caninum Liverpool]|eukprot:XP_003884133.1 conserved hypothetical protein [Neospora caninum Liverpool]
MSRSSPLVPCSCCSSLVSPQITPSASSASLLSFPACFCSCPPSSCPSSLPSSLPALFRSLRPPYAESAMSVSGSKRPPSSFRATTGFALRQRPAFHAAHAHYLPVARAVSAPRSRAVASFPTQAGVSSPSSSECHSLVPSLRGILSSLPRHFLRVCNFAAAYSPRSFLSACTVHASASASRPSYDSSPFPLSLSLTASSSPSLLVAPLRLSLPRSSAARLHGVSQEVETARPASPSWDCSASPESARRHAIQPPLLSLPSLGGTKRLLSQLMRRLVGSAFLALPVLFLLSQETPLFAVYPERRVAVRLSLLPRGERAEPEEETREEGEAEGQRERTDGGTQVRGGCERDGSEGGSGVESLARESRDGEILERGGDAESRNQGDDGFAPPLVSAGEGKTPGSSDVSREKAPAELSLPGHETISLQAASSDASANSGARGARERQDDNGEDAGEGTFVLASPWAVQAFSRGDLVYFRHPMDSKCKLLLRVVAVAHDVIRVSASSLLSIHPTLRKQLLVFGEPRVVDANGVPFRCDVSYDFLMHLVDCCNEEILAAAYQGKRARWFSFQPAGESEAGATEKGEAESGSDIFVELKIPAGSCWLEADADTPRNAPAPRRPMRDRHMQSEKAKTEEESKSLPAKREEDLAGGKAASPFAPASVLPSSLVSSTPDACQASECWTRGGDLEACLPPMCQDSYSFGLAPVGLIQGVVYAILPHTHSEGEAQLLLCQAFLSSLVAEARESRLLTWSASLGEKAKRAVAKAEAYLGGLRVREDEQASGKAACAPLSRPDERQGSAQCRSRLEEDSELGSWQSVPVTGASEEENTLHREDKETGAEAKASRATAEPGEDTKGHGPLCPEAESGRAGGLAVPPLPNLHIVLPTQRADAREGEGHDVMETERHREEHGRPEERGEGRREAGETKANGHQEDGEREPERSDDSEGEGLDEVEEAPLMYRLLSRATQWLIAHADMRGLALPDDNPVSSKGTIVVDCSEYRGERHK